MLWYFEIVLWVPMAPFLVGGYWFGFAGWELLGWRFYARKCADVGVCARVDRLC